MVILGPMIRETRKLGKAFSSTSPKTRETVIRAADKEGSLSDRIFVRGAVGSAEAFEREQESRQFVRDATPDLPEGPGDVIPWWLKPLLALVFVAIIAGQLGKLLTFEFGGN